MAAQLEVGAAMLVGGHQALTYLQVVRVHVGACSAGCIHLDWQVPQLQS